jgi:hypothetical protein
MATGYWPPRRWRETAKVQRGFAANRRFVMPTFMFIPRCLECREPAAVVDDGKYFCGSCFLARTLHRHHEEREAEPQRITSRAS